MGSGTAKNDDASATMMLTPLGVSATETADHETTGFHVQTSDASIVVDCSPGVVRQLLRSDVDLSDIDAVVITHCHGDHTSGFSYLLFSINLARVQSGQEARPLTVIATQDNFRGLSAILAFQYPPGEFPKVPLRFSPIEGGKVHTVGSTRVATAPVKHAVPTFAVRVESSSGSAVAISSDTSYAESLVELASHVDVLVHEAFVTQEKEGFAKSSGHSTAAEAGRVAREANVGRLYLAHVLPVYLSDPEVLLTEARQEFGGAVSIPDETVPIAV